VSAGAFLPPVVTRLTGDIDDLAAKIAEAKRLIDSLDGKTARVRVDVGGALAQIDRVKAALAGLDSKTIRINTIGDGRGGGFRLGFGWLGGLRMTGSVLHWLITGFAELMAVVIPATIAIGAWAAVWLQGATNVAEHMKAVYTATEATSNMFHMTAGQAVGLGNALQKAQDAANPDVYQALGSALLIIKERSGGVIQSGTQLGKVFDTFMAKAAQDFSKTGSLGSSLDHVMANMVGDAAGLGQVFGNLGHILLGTAGQMPGLAEWLLKTLSFITRLGVDVIDMAGKFRIGGISILTLAMAFEEFNRWGGLLMGVLGRMGLTMYATGTRALSFARTMAVLKAVFSIIPAIIGNIGVAFALMGGFMRSAGTAMIAFAAKVQLAIDAMTPFQVLLVALAVAALGFLIYKLATAKDSMQSLVSTMQDAADKASNLQVLGRLAQDMVKLSSDTRKVSGSMTTMAGTASRLAGPAMTSTGRSAAEAAAGVRKFGQQFVTVTTHARELAGTYRTSFVGALALADQAGVKLNQTMDRQAWAIAKIKIQSLVAGYKAMGQPAGAVGADMTALAIQSGLAATQVDKLNSAWDEFMQNLTGGTSGLAQFDQSLKQLTTGANTVSTVLGKSGNLSLSIKSFAKDLTSFTGKGAQAWQNFDQVVSGTAPQLINWFRKAGAEGAISGRKFQKGVLDMLSALTPLASKSKTAQAELMGLANQAGLKNVHSFADLQRAIKNSGASTKDLARIVEDTTKRMGNMSQVAQNLGNVMNHIVSTSMAQAALSTVGFQRKVIALDQAIKRYGANSPQAQAAARKLASAQAQANRIIAEGVKLTGRLQRSIDGLHSKTIDIGVNTIYSSTGTPVAGLGAPGHQHLAAGTSSARRGWSWVGELGPELIHLGGGERVMPNHQATGSSGAAVAGGGGVTEIRLYLDGKELFGGIKRQTHQYDVRNNNRSRGGKPAGVLVPG